MAPSPHWALVIGIGLTTAARAFGAPPPPTGGANAATAAEPVYVGRAACAPCHKAEAEKFAGSHHDRAMQVANATTVLGDFNNATFTYNGVTSTFFKKDGAFFVRTDGPDGALHEYRIAYTFGIDPLQQYLVEFPGGRLQALSICWDTRPKAAGGQRWFHLYPDEKVDFRDVLHWTGPAQNWNYMCADCHSTNVKKNYDAATERFATKWSEVDVSCEACHGPGSKHVEWARPSKQAGHALPDDADPGARSSTSPPAAARGCSRATPRSRTSAARGTRACRSSARAVMRAARRSATDYRQDQPLGQTHIAVPARRTAVPRRRPDPRRSVRVRLLSPEPDARTRRRLHRLPRSAQRAAARRRQRGVRASVTGRRTTTPRRIITTRRGPRPHAASQCHMLARNYMVVHKRHDHSFRVPRPDLSVTLGTPNTCTDCHHERSAQWAADAVVRWYGPTRAARAELCAGVGRRPASAGRRRPACSPRSSPIALSRPSSAPRH